MTDALLLQPPPGDLTGPYPALPYLKSYAGRQGFQVIVRDLGIEAFNYLTRGQPFLSLLEKSAQQRRALEKLPFLNPGQQRRFGLLASVMGLELKPELMARTLDCFKDEILFYDYDRYREAAGYLNAFFRLLSAVCYPGPFTAADYPRVRTLGQWSHVLAHENPEYNPYIDYYEKVLFPDIAADPPGVVGISMVFGAQSVQAVILARMIKKRFPDIHVTLGGAYLSQWILVMEKPQLRDFFKGADSVICGEGEKPFCDLLVRVKTGQSLDGLPNLIFPDPVADEFHYFSELTYTDVPSIPPPDFSDLDMEAYLIPRPVIPYSISRGCYWGKCVFCQNRYGDGRMRLYQTVPVEKALAEMADLTARYRTNHVNFSNDVIDPAYLKQLSQNILDRGLKLVWNTDLRAEKAFTPELCHLMAQAGLNSVALGFESGCDQTLKAMDKGIEVENAGQVMANLYRSGVATQAMGMFGFPGESFAHGLETIRFLEKNQDHISYYVMGLLMVLPGSKMYAAPEKYGVDSISFENNPLRAPEPVWRSRTRMSATDVNRLYQRLGRLESVYALDEYPLVGGLSTNHGFLYFEKGPDILKKLRQVDKDRHLALHRILGIDENHEFSMKVKKVIPRVPRPYLIYHSPFPLEKIQMDDSAPVFQNRLEKGLNWDYFMDAIEMPIPMGPQELSLIKKIDGRRNLRTILTQINLNNPKKMLYFLMYMLNKRLMLLRGGL